jgi:Domain of unknown function (DUF4352)/Protein of unknown function (DUF2510)
LLAIVVCLRKGIALTNAPSPPPGWYPDPSGAPGQRYFNGRDWTEHRAAAPLPPPPPQPPKKSKLPIVLGVGAAVLVLLFIIGSISGGETSDTTAGTTSSASPGVLDDAQATTGEPVARMNQEVRDGKFAFVVTRVNTSDMAGDPSNPYMQEKPQGMFVNVFMTVINIGDRPQTFFADNQKLMAGGREYSANTMAAVWTGASNVEINPGNSIEAVVSFDVPLGITLSAIELHDSAFSGGVPVEIT